MTIHSPSTVFTARLAAVPSSTDQVISITYNSGSGTHTNILVDQTLLVGSAAGLSDYGMARIRSLTGIGATTGTFNIGEESEVDWTAGAYLTVLDEFLIWPKHIKMSGTTPYIDEVLYTDENTNCDSVPVLGPHRVLWLEGTTVSTTLDSGNSWALNNSITGYVWTAPGASATSGLTTATPTITYNATGVYRVGCTVTNDDSKSFTGYRYIFVVTESSGVTSQFTLDSLEGSQAAGGWTCGITLYDNATLALIRDRALCIVHTKDWYGNTRGSIGFVAGAENILFEGWLSTQQIKRGRDDQWGTVSFDIQGPQFWLDNITAFPVGLKDTTAAPTKWTRFLGLTPKATVWHFLHWRSTITRCCDVYPLDNSWRAARIEAPGAQTLWQQLASIEDTTVKARPCADRLGRLFNEVEQQLLSDRSAIPEVMTITTADLTGEIDIEYNPVDRSALTDLSGVSYDGTSPAVCAGLSPGRVFARMGKIEAVDRLVCYDSAQTIALSGLHRGWTNNQFPRISNTFASNMRLCDIAPHMYFNQAIAAADTPRGIAFSGRIIPRALRGTYENGYMLWPGDFEAETFEQLAIAGETVTPIVIVPVDPPPPPPAPPPIPPPISTATEKWFATDQNYIYWSGDYFGDQPTWNEIGSLPLTMARNSTTKFSPPFLITQRGAVFVANGDHIYVSSNPKAVTPTWTHIFEKNVASVAGYTANGVFYGAHVTRNTLSGFCHINANSDSWAYGEYTTAAGWTWTRLTDANLFNYDGYGYRTFAYYYFGDRTFAVPFTYVDGTYIHAGEILLAPNNVRYGIRYVDGAAAYLRIVGSGTDIATVTATGFVANDVSNIRFRSSITGTTITYISKAGDLWLSSNGTTFANIANWGAGWVDDASVCGGGTLDWTRMTVTANNVPMRLYNRDGTVLRDMTGDFWSYATGDLEIFGTGLVFI